MWIVHYPGEATLDNWSRYFSSKTCRNWSFVTNLRTQISCLSIKPKKKWNQKTWERKSLTRSLPVFLTEASTVSLSQGMRVFRSISSQEIPSWGGVEIKIQTWDAYGRQKTSLTFSASIQACSITDNWAPQPTSVMSLPGRISWSSGMRIQLRRKEWGSRVYLSLW